MVIGYSGVLSTRSSCKILVLKQKT